MQLQDALDSVSGLRFVVDQAPLLSGLGRRYLYASHWIDRADELLTLYAELAQMSHFLECEETAVIANFDHLVSQVRDIESTINGLMGGMILSDIEFFEIKSFAIVAEQIRELIADSGFSQLSSLKQVVDILDPEHSGVTAFHIYDIYSAELAAVRAELKQLTGATFTLTVEGQNVDSCRDDKAAELYQRSLSLEDGVRKNLAFQLRPLAATLRAVLRAIASLDVRQAKIRLAQRLNLVKPTISNAATSYQSLFNPQIADALTQSGKRYQPIDIDFDTMPTLISGINMGGKTVCLKTIALAQYMFQFGLYVPAAEACIALVSRVMIVVDDNQCEISGLSSFAGEMRQIDDIIRVVRKDCRVLVLIDELARTTNPIEGRAIVEAMLHLLTKHNVRSFVSSHYDNIHTSARQLRVKGLREDTTETTLDVNHIDRYIDYSLVCDNDTSAPHEALRIARLIGIDEDFIADAEHRI